MSRILPPLAALLLCFGPSCIEETTPDHPEDDDDVVGCEYAAVDCPDPGGLAYTAAAQPNVMLLVDRSGSMSQSGACPGSSCPSKWEQLMALAPYVDGIDQTGRLGLTLFPAPLAGDACSVDGSIVVPIGEQTGPAVLHALDGTRPGGSTPLAGALDELREKACLADPSRDNVVVLLTDGEPNCACGSDAACERTSAVEATRALVNGDVPVEVYVIGFGASAGDAEQTLRAIAWEAEGTSGPDNFYRADTVEELVERMDRVAGQLGGCTYFLDERVDPTQLQVFVDGEAAPRCEAPPCESGWSTTDGKAIDLEGVTCRQAATQDCPPVRFDLQR